MLSNVRRSASRSPLVEPRRQIVAAIISNSGDATLERERRQHANHRVQRHHRGAVFALSHLRARLEQLRANSRRHAAATARPAFPGANPTSSASPVRNVVGGPIIPVELRRAAASSANSTPALNIPARADSGLTLSATDAPAAAQASRKSRGPRRCTRPPSRFADKAASAARARASARASR